MPTLQLGNEAVVEAVKIDEHLDAAPNNIRKVRRTDLGNQVTSMSIPDTHVQLEKDGTNVTMWPVDEQIATIRRFVDLHFAGKPAWVECNNPALQAVVANMYGCPEGRPKNWKQG